MTKSIHKELNDLREKIVYERNQINRFKIVRNDIIKSETDRLNNFCNIKMKKYDNLINRINKIIPKIKEE